MLEQKNFDPGLFATEKLAVDLTDGGTIRVAFDETLKIAIPISWAHLIVGMEVKHFASFTDKVDLPHEDRLLEELSLVELVAEGRKPFDRSIEPTLEIWYIAMCCG